MSGSAHEVTSVGEAHTMAIAATIAPRLVAGDIVALVGELGAGKTRFVRGLAEGLGVDPGLVHSPTFVLANEYPAPRGDGRSGGAAVLVHVDAYRFDPDEGSGGETGSLDLDTLVERGAIAVIEWADRLADLDELGPILTVRLEHLGETTRLLTLTGDERLIGGLGGS